jgi:hypothetical protein
MIRMEVMMKSIDGTETYEWFTNQTTGERAVRYIYRTVTGSFFVAAVRTLEIARASRDAWLQKHGHIAGKTAVIEIKGGPEG